MPDDDRWATRLPPRWQKVWRCLRRGASLDDTAAAAAAALARTLRDVGGVPSLPLIADSVHHQARARMSQLDLGLATAGADLVPSDYHPPTSMAEQAASALLHAYPAQLADASPEVASEMVAQRVSREIACHYGFDRMVHRLAHGGTKSLGQIRSEIEAVLAHPLLGQVAQRLVKHPDGRNLHAPRVRRRRLTQHELLNVDLEGI